MSLITDIATAVETELKIGTFSLPFTAQRHYRPQFDLAELKALRVSVVPRSITIATLGRNVNQHEVAIDVAVQKKVAPADVGDHAELDGLVNLVQEIADFFRLRRLSTFQEAAWSKTENVPVYSPEHLETKAVFTSVLTLTFKVMR